MVTMKGTTLSFILNLIFSILDRSNEMNHYSMYFIYDIFFSCAGLGSLYGDHELQDENMDRNVENRIIDKYLVPHFERF